MAYRNLFIESPARISCKNEQLVITTDADRSVPIEDTSALLIESRQSSITTAALSALAQNGTVVYVCDEKHLPCGVLLPFCQHSRQKAVLTAQLSIGVPTAKRLWQQIVMAKISNQAECLFQCGKEEQGQYLLARAASVTSGDVGNQEAVAAAYYFPALFGKGFTRGEDSMLNAALNYGYAIMRGCVARALTVYGFLPSIGLHHASDLNQYNLADDLMEPFRPLVDLFVAENVDSSMALTPEVKHQLFNLLQYDILSDGQRHSVAYAIERAIQSLVRCTNNKKQTLLLPKLLPLKLHTYE